MTNYNERLDEIVERIRRGMRRELGDISPHIEAGYTRDNAKKALTSLIKELVAESKPGYDAVKNSERDKAIDQFEQNLLKALESSNG